MHANKSTSTPVTERLNPNKPKYAKNVRDDLRKKIAIEKEHSALQKKKSNFENVQKAINDFVSNTKLKKFCDTLESRKCAKIFPIFIKYLQSENTILEETMKRCYCQRDEAQTYIDEFCQNANRWLNGEANDYVMLIDLVKTHDDLRKMCEERWQEQNNRELEERKAELERRFQTDWEKYEEERKQLRQQYEEERSQLETDLQKVRDQRKQEQEAIKKLIADKKQLDEELCFLNVQFEEKSAELSRGLEAEKAKVNKELEEKKAEIRAIEERLSEAIRLQLEKAKEVAAISTPPATPIYFPGEPLLDDVRLASSWSHCFDALVKLNLKAVVKKDYRPLIGAFLYASYKLKNNLLLAGPGGERLANALSTAVCGRRAGTVVCDGDWDEASVLAAENGDGKIVVVKNALHSRWLERWPERLEESKKRWIFTCPFADDLTIQPRGLFDYLLPVLTEVFVKEENGSVSFSGTRKAKDFKEYDDAEEDEAFFDKAVLKKAKASERYVVRLQKTLNRAFRILTADKEKQKMLFYLFGATPYAYATGRLNALKGAFDGEQAQNKDDDWREFVKTLAGDDDDER